MRRSWEPGIRYPRKRPESNHLLTVRGATLQIFATWPVVKTFFMFSYTPSSSLVPGPPSRRGKPVGTVGHRGAATGSEPGAGDAGRAGVRRAGAIEPCVRRWGHLRPGGSSIDHAVPGVGPVGHRGSGG